VLSHGAFAGEFAGDGVDDADFEVVDEQDDVHSFVGSAGSDVAGASRSRHIDAALVELGVLGPTGDYCP
jgi:hypothetical protein